MKEIDKKFYYEIDGGFSLSSAIINSFVKGINTILDLGRSLGTAIRRGSSRKLCSI